MTSTSSMTSTTGPNRRPVDWQHAVACLLVAVTAVLLCFGALVTTFDAAMAVPDWPATYGHNMFLFPWSQWFHGPWDLFLEHGHRLLGAVVGLLSLLLAAAVWRWPASQAVRGLAAAAVLLVIVQGALGGARVLLDDKTVAKVHACTGPLFFAVAVAVAALTRRSSRTGAAADWPGRTTAAAVAAGLTLATYVQLVAGAQLRHLDASVDPLTFRWLVAFHVVGAGAVAVLAVAAVVSTRSAVHRPLRRGALAVLGLVACQVALGCGAWIVTWGVPSGFVPAAWSATDPLVARSLWAATVVTGHVVLGMMILGVAVVLAIATGAPWAGRPGTPARLDRFRENAYA